MKNNFVNKLLIVAAVFFKQKFGLQKVVGVVLGVYMDKTGVSYSNQIIISPNFGSVDYLYAKVDLINSKINERDTVFLKEQVGIKETKKLQRIKIEPISDVYKFIENKPENFEMLKVMAEDGDIKKIIEEKTTSKNYPYHIISFNTQKATSTDKTVQPIMDYLNNSDYYKKIQKEYLKNVEIKIKQNDTIITQINSVLNNFSSVASGVQRSDKLVYYNENTQLNDVIKTKDELVKEQGAHRIDMINLDKIVKEISATINVVDTKSLNGKMKLILPFLFVFFYLMGTWFSNFYKKQLVKSKL